MIMLTLVFLWLVVEPGLKEDRNIKVCHHETFSVRPDTSV